MLQEKNRGALSLSRFRGSLGDEDYAKGSQSEVSRTRRKGTPGRVRIMKCGDKTRYMLGRPTDIDYFRAHNVKEEGGQQGAK
jgi:hypothetical protein